MANGEVAIPDVGAAYNDEEKALQLDEYSKSFSSVMAPTTTTAPLNQSYSVAVGNQVSLGDKPFGFLGTLTYSNNSSFYDNGTSARWQLTSKEASTLTNNFNLADTQGSQEIAWAASSPCPSNRPPRTSYQSPTCTIATAKTSPAT